MESPILKWKHRPQRLEPDGASLRCLPQGDIALLANGDPDQVLSIVLPRLRSLPGPTLELATGTLTLLSGILGREAILREKLKEFGMIDVMENKILGPAIRQGIEQGIQQGISTGKREIIHEILVERFGPLPAWAEQRIADATAEQIDRWVKLVIRAESLAAILD